jgi:hypothetical protein
VSPKRLNCERSTRIELLSKVVLGSLTVLRGRHGRVEKWGELVYRNAQHIPILDDRPDLRVVLTDWNGAVRLVGYDRTDLVQYKNHQIVLMDWLKT